MPLREKPVHKACFCAKALWLLPKHFSFVSASPWSIGNGDALYVVAIVVIDNSLWVPQRAEDAGRINNAVIRVARVGAVITIVVPVSVIAVFTE